MNFCPVCGERYGNRRRVCTECRFDLQYLPMEVREPLTIEDGAVEGWSVRELPELKALGQAPSIRKQTPRGTYYIPQHHVLSYVQLLFIVDAFKNIAARFNLQMLFRGQTRDYFGGAGDLIVLPTVARNET